MKIYRHLPKIILAILLIAIGIISPASAQDITNHRPINMMMIVIDNSCSMFPINQILAGCDASGSDPDFLRIIGADLFIARLGYSEPNEADYKLGIIAMGDKPKMIANLQPIDKVRADLAAKIANPKPQPATRVVPAMQMAYSESVPGTPDDVAGQLLHSHLIFRPDAVAAEDVKAGVPPC
jgi:hypothetical protein